MKILATSYDKSKVSEGCLFTVVMEHEGKHVAMSVKTENKKIVSVKPYSADKETYDSFCVFCKNAFVEKSEARVKQILNND